MFPKQLHRSVWVQADAFGHRVGRLDLSLLKGSSEFMDVSAKSSLEKNIEDLRKRMQDPESAKEMKSLKEALELLIERRSKLPDTEGQSTYENFLTLLHPGMASDPEIERIISSSADQSK
jgi:hypothetical protein